MSAQSLAARPAARLPGPPELLPGRPDAIVDLQTEDGVALVAGEWRYADARIEETMLRLASGRVCFNWYRIEITIPQRVGDFDPTGSTVVFEVVVDDYAEVWVDGELPLVLGITGGPVVGGFNAPNRVVLTRDARPGDRFALAVFGINGPISAAPPNYIWMRTATLDLFAAERARPAQDAPLVVDRLDPRLDDIVPADARLERVAEGFEFTDGAVWSPDGGLLFSSPNTNAIYRWDARGEVTVFRAKSGYAGVDIGRYAQPGSNGLTYDPDGRLAICQHGNRRVVRVNPHGDVTVVASAYGGRRLNSPDDLVYRSDGTLYFTDPPFGLPGGFDDPARELPFSGVFRVRDGDVVLLSDELDGPSGLALSPDERFLYVGNSDVERKVVMRYELDVAGDALDAIVFCDLTGAPGDDAIDAIKVDRAGNVYACGPGGISVLSPGGERLGLLELPEAPHNLAWGDEDGRTMYVTAPTSVYRVRLGIAGVRPIDARKDTP
ncbi:MAG TPA: SMP-30/gluconolactonase/LRE family protein [Solirubrobacteraceae bacterium]|nr:SMP-30/gluconolactonase/LRE family protein [Solirubrobacteraceae bacterium]